MRNLRNVRLVGALLCLATGPGTSAQSEELLHDYGSWGVITFGGASGDPVYWAQTTLDAKHILDEDDEGARLRFGCSRATRPLPKFLIFDTKGETNLIFTDRYTVDWQVGSLPPIRVQGQSITLFDPFDSPPATQQALEGERSKELLMIRLSNPYKGTTQFERLSVGTKWPKLFTARLDGFRAARDFVLEKCND